jgi:hypothetical protein
MRKEETQGGREDRDGEARREKGAKRARGRAAARPDRRVRRARRTRGDNKIWNAAKGGRTCPRFFKDVKRIFQRTKTVEEDAIADG